jgi:hypothetical protein
MFKARTTLVLTMILGLFALGCQSLGGQRSIAGVAEYELDRVPYFPDKPTVVIVPERVSWKLSNNSFQGIVASEDFLTAMLVSALGRHGNIRLLDPTFAHNTAHAGARDKGPFKVRVLLTEMDQFSTIEDSGFDPWRYDSAATYLWKPPITVLGFWVSMLTGLPSVYLTTEVKGVVGIDVEVIDIKTNRIVTSFPVHGTHTEAARQVGNQMFGAYVKTDARSTFSGASRVALNEAVDQLYKKLAAFEGSL